MSGRVNRAVTYITDQEDADLEDRAREAGKSKSDILRQALQEYLDHDRVARVEAELREIQAELQTDDSHTHTQHVQSNQGTTATEKARRIVRRLQSNHDEVMKTDAVDRAIEDIAGVDPRTKRKYKTLFRKRGLLFEHPSDDGPPLWTTDADQWLDWMAQYAALNGRDETEDVVADYPATYYEHKDGAGIELDDTDAELEVEA